MIKKTITFENFLGEEETDSFYFNLSKGELVKMQMSAINQKTESFQDKLEKIGKTLNGQALVDVVDEIVLNGFGVKSTDGKKFTKSAQLSEDFKSTGAYSELIVELCTSADAMAEFVNGLVPAKLREEVKNEVATTQTARERSEALMGGHQQKQEAPKPSVQVVPELPAAEPVLEDPSVAEFEAWKASQAQADKN